MSTDAAAVPAKPTGEAPELPTPSEEARNRALDNAVTGGRTATGQAIEQRAGIEDARIDSLETHGSSNPIAGGDSIRPDFPEHTHSEPIGLQAQPAFFTTNGSLDPAMVASPTGLVPVASVATSAEDAVNRVQAHLDAVEAQFAGAKKAHELTEEDVNRLSGPDLRAVAATLGYDIGENGTRTARRRFIQAMQNDPLRQPTSAGTSSTEANPASAGAVDSGSTPAGTSPTGAPGGAGTTGTEPGR